MARAEKLLAVYQQAIPASGVKHVVFLSSIGADREDSGIVKSVWLAERELGQLPVAMTFIRAGYFMENWAGSLQPVLQGALPTFFTPDQPVPMIATRDIGEVAARSLLEPAPGHRVIDLAGPKDYTVTEVAAVFRKLLNKPVAVQAGPLEAMVPAFKGFGMSDEMAVAFRDLTAGLNDGRIKFGGGSLVRGTTPLEAVLKQLLAN
jgi:uncharacterized protein YbjT (DUF2867 family)